VLLLWLALPNQESQMSFFSQLRRHNVIRELIAHNTPAPKHWLPLDFTCADH